MPSSTSTTSAAIPTGIYSEALPKTRPANVTWALPPSPSRTRFDRRALITWIDRTTISRISRPLHRAAA